MNPSSHSLEFHLPDEAATVGLAQQLARLIRAPETHPGAPGASAPTGVRIHLRGALGTGKTTLARALLRACGVAGRIKSPSYAVVESYNVSNLYFYHLDFYRFSSSQEWRDTGLDELIDERAVVLIEWPEQAGTRLPPPDLDIVLTQAGAGRRATLTASSEKGQQWLTHLNSTRQQADKPASRAAD